MTTKTHTLTRDDLRAVADLARSTARDAFAEFGPVEHSRDDAEQMADGLTVEPLAACERAQVVLLYLDTFDATMAALAHHGDAPHLRIPTTEGAAREWIRSAVAFVGLGFHPDIPAADYVETENLRPLFTSAEVRAWDAAQDAAVDLLGWSAFYSVAEDAMHTLDVTRVQVPATVRHAPLHWHDVEPDPYAALPTRSRDWKTLRRMAEEVDGVTRSGRSWSENMCSHEESERQGAAAFLSLLHRHLPRGWDYSWAMTGGGCSAWEVFRPGDPRGTVEQSENAPWIWITGSGRGESSGDLSDGAMVGAYLSYEDSCGGPDDDGVLIAETFTADPVAILRRMLAGCAWIDARKGPSAL